MLFQRLLYFIGSVDLGIISMPKGNPKPIKYDINERGCHICTSHSCRRGYPSKRVKFCGKWIMVNIVKYLWEQINGIVEEGKGLLHSCDDRLCINIEHVQPGTNADNMHDKMIRGKCVTKLTEDNVRFIRANRFPDGEGLSGSELARKFNVSASVIFYIVHRKLWRHV